MNPHHNFTLLVFGRPMHFGVWPDRSVGFHTFSGLDDFMSVKDFRYLFGHCWLDNKHLTVNDVLPL